MVQVNKISLKNRTSSLKKAVSNEQPNVINGGDKTTFDISKVKSTVENPSAVFKGISVDDEAKIYKIVNEQFSGASEFEKTQAIQGLYTAALSSQKQKDIDSGRNNMKLDLINRANNESSTKMKNEYMTQVKRSNLADLIKQQLDKEGVDRSTYMNVTDFGIIQGFLESNPEYNEAFNKYYYGNGDTIALGKELGWIEKSGTDKARDWIKNVGEGLAGWMPKFGEGVSDLLNLGDEGQGFYNYVQDKYGTYPGALTESDLAKAKQEYEGVDKKEYTPTLQSGLTKTAEGTVDILASATGPGALLKGGMSLASNTPYLEIAPELLSKGISGMGGLVNKLPGAKQLRDSLQNEKEKEDFDMLVGGFLLEGLVKGTKKGTQLSKGDLGATVSELKKGGVKSAWETLKETAESNRVKGLQEEKLKQAQRVGQGELETRESMAKGLDTLNEKGKLDTIKSADEFSTAIDKEIENLKKTQTVTSQKSSKKYGEADLMGEESVDMLNKKGEKVSQKVGTKDFSELVDRIVDHYETVGDTANMRKYQSYRKALKNGVLTEEGILEIRREGNRLNQSIYNSKTNLVKDTNKAEQWSKNMKNVNKIIEGLDMGKEVREIDSKLSGLYTLKSGVEKIKSSAAKIESQLDTSTARKVGSTINRMINMAAMGGWNWVKSAGLAFLKEGISEQTGPKTYGKLEIANKIPEFIKEYQKLEKQISDKNLPKNKLEKIANQFADHWEMILGTEGED